MAKDLSELSLQELWQLFPITLTPHQLCWKSWYYDEEHALRAALPPNSIARISHIGSTAIPGIWAKPAVDILLEAAEGVTLQTLREGCERCGYFCMSERPGRLSFNKGYTPEGFASRVFHLHLRHSGDHDELFFRDYLLEHEDVAKEYALLKLRLWKKYEHDRDAYTASKGAFILRYTQKSKQNDPCRYDAVL